MSCTRSEIVKQMQSWVGLKESDGSHKKIIDIYNTIKPLPVGYKLKYTDAWCAGTVSAAAKACNALDIIPAECSCPRMVELLKKQGIWQERDDYVPQPGDLIFFDWQDNGKGDNTGNPDHVGIIECVVGGKTLHIIEGNLSDSVKRRYFSVNEKYIRGYGVPKYTEEPKKSETAKEVGTVVIKLNVLQKGAEGEQVKALQRMLWAMGYYNSSVDGDFGSMTDEAVRAFQRKNGLVVDGIVGEQTWTFLLRGTE